jgi:hypothetical protein
LADMLLLWWTMHFVLREMVEVIRAARFQRSALYWGMNSSISHSNESIIHILIFCNISTSIVPLLTLQLYVQFFFANSSYFNLNVKPANPSLALHHNFKDLPPILFPSKSCCHHGKREVPWLWQVVHLDWTTPDVPQSLLVSDGGTCLPAETHCWMLAATATRAWTP